MTGRVRKLLDRRQEFFGDLLYVFPGRDPEKHLRFRPWTTNTRRFDPASSKARKPKTSVSMIRTLSSTRCAYTMLTRLGESGADPYTIMKIVGHSSIIVSQRYVHPTPERMESAFAQMEAMNQIMRGDEEAGEMLGVPAESTNDDRS